MNMGSYLKRTNKTNLTDEELLILDVLFDAGDTFESLQKENYASWHNLPYSHHLEAGRLRDLINKLLHNGMLKAYTMDQSNKVFYALTEAGGKQWEVERAPDWERYCMDSSKEDENSNWIVFIESPSSTTAKAFVDWVMSCHFYEFKQEEMKTITLIDEKLSTVYWRTFPTVCSISAATYASPEINKVDWAEYESKRTWWRSLTELAKFQLI